VINNEVISCSASWYWNWRCGVHHHHRSERTSRRRHCFVARYAPHQLPHQYLSYTLLTSNLALSSYSSVTHWLWIDRSDPIRSNHTTKMDHEILQQLELLCEREAKHEDPTGEARERLLRLQSTLEYLPQCRLLLEQSESPYALLWASTSMAKMMIERWSAVHNDAVRRALSRALSRSLSRARNLDSSWFFSITITSSSTIITYDR